MKPTTIKNAEGETIEIKTDADGTIHIRHSDIDPEAWGELHEYAKRMRQPKVGSFLTAKGIDPKSPLAKEVAGKLGGYVVLHGQTYHISASMKAFRKMRRMNMCSSSKWIARRKSSIR